jgi:glyceraldehyde-3-phosphate dehydrogenase/erythrose-4-phosphate dehydrogenase
LRMLVWYDNESGYSAKVLDVLDLISKRNEK